MKKILLAYNPVSGHAAFKNKLDSVIENFQRRGIFLSVYRTRAEDNSAFADCVKIFQPEGIIAAGGDGTLHAVINLLMKSKIDLPVGIIGSGTSNDFATYLGINKNLEEYFDRIANFKTRRVDVGLVNGEKYFINVVSAGAFTAIAHEVNVKLKNFLGKPAYYIQGFKELTKFKAIIFNVTSNKVNFEFDAFLFIVLNSSAVAGLKNVADFAKVDDGELNLLAIKKCSTRKLFRITKNLFLGKGVDINDENIFHLQGKNFVITSANDLTSDIDGEIGAKLPIKIETVPNAVEIFV